MAEEIIFTGGWDGSERRRFMRVPTISNARLRRTKPSHPGLQNVHARDLSSFGVCFTVASSALYKVNDEIRCTFVLRLPPNIIKVHFRLCRVAWAKNGRLGLQFLRDDAGNPLT